MFIRVEEMEAGNAADEVINNTRKNVSDLLKVCRNLYFFTFFKTVSSHLEDVRLPTS